MIKALFSAIFIAAGSLAAFGQNNSAQAPADPCGNTQPDIQSIPRLVDAIRKSTDVAVVQCLERRLAEKTPETKEDLSVILKLLYDSRLSAVALEAVGRTKNPKLGDMLYHAFERYWLGTNHNPEDAVPDAANGGDAWLDELSLALRNVHYNPNAPALKEYRQFQKKVADLERKRGLANLDWVIAETKRDVTPEACKKLTEGEGVYIPREAETDPRLLDADLYVLERSSAPECVGGPITGLNVAIQQVHDKRGTISARQWKKIGNALIDALNNQNLLSNDWSIQIYWAAPALEEMGPPYRQAAYDWYLSALRKLANEKTITDNRREFAMKLVWHLLGAKQKIPTKLLREVVQKVDLIKFVRKYELSIGPSYRVKEEERIAKVEQLLKAK